LNMVHPRDSGKLHPLLTVAGKVRRAPTGTSREARGGPPRRWGDELRWGVNEPQPPDAAQPWRASELARSNKRNNSENRERVLISYDPMADPATFPPIVRGILAQADAERAWDPRLYTLLRDKGTRVHEVTKLERFHDGKTQYLTVGDAVWGHEWCTGLLPSAAAWTYPRGRRRCTLPARVWPAEGGSARVHGRARVEVRAGGCVRVRARVCTAVIDGRWRTFPVPCTLFTVPVNVP
jgi:hypothetical protein